MNEPFVTIGENATSPWVRIPLKAIVLYFALYFEMNAEQIVIVLLMLLLTEIPEFYGYKISHKHPHLNRQVSICLGTMNITLAFALLWYTNLVDSDLYLLIYLVIAAVSMASGVIGGAAGGLLSAVLYLVISAPILTPFESMFRAIMFALTGTIIGIIAEANLVNMNNSKANEEKVSHRDEANNLKENFLSLAYHGLRTPLTAIKGYAAALSDQSLIDDERQTYFHFMQDSIKNMSAIMENVFRVIKIDEDFELSIEDTEMVTFIAEITKELQPFLKQKNVTFDCGLPENKTIQLKVDRNRMKSALNNIIDNAIRYSDANDKVCITLTEDLKQVIITVSDQGKGIPQNEIPYLFEKFHRVNVLTPDSEGLGIGLYMTHKIIEKHGGIIKVASKEGEGTSITIILPKETGRTFFEGLG